MEVYLTEGDKPSRDFYQFQIKNENGIRRYWACPNISVRQMRAHAQATFAADTHTHDTSVQSGNYVTGANLEGLGTFVLVRAANDVAAIKPAHEMEFHPGTLCGFCAGPDDEIFNFQPGQSAIRFHAPDPDDLVY